MPNANFVLRAFQQLDNNLIILRRISGLSFEEFIADPFIIGSAERYLQVSIEICLDVTRHIIATESLGNPQTHAEAFAMLAQESIISDGLLSTLQRMAGFRNRLVHLYWEIEQAIVHEIVATQLSDFELFRDHIIVYLDQRGLI